MNDVPIPNMTMVFDASLETCTLEKITMACGDKDINREITAYSFPSLLELVTLHTALPTVLETDSLFDLPLILNGELTVFDTFVSKFADNARLPPMPEPAKISLEFLVHMTMLNSDNWCKSAGWLNPDSVAYMRSHLKSVPWMN